MWRKLVILLVLAAVAAGPRMASAADEAAEPPESSGTISDLKITDKDYSLGNPDAKVVIVEYASLTCPHCAHFQNTVMPDLTKEFIDTGKVRYIYRDFPLDQYALRAAMVARCGGRDTYFGYIDTFFATQARWAALPNPVQGIENVARMGGMSPKQFDACMKNVDVQNAVLQQRLQAANEFKINATPTIFINGARYDGGMTFPQLRTLLDRLLAKKS